MSHDWIVAGVGQQAAKWLIVILLIGIAIVGTTEQGRAYMCERCVKLEKAILDIDAKATPYGPPIVEAGQEFARAYLIPAGPLHRALGVVGHSAAHEGTSWLKSDPQTIQDIKADAEARAVRAMNSKPIALD